MHLGFCQPMVVTGRVRDGGGAYPVPQATLPASQVPPAAWHLPSAVQVLPVLQ